MSNVRGNWAWKPDLETRVALDRGEAKIKAAKLRASRHRATTRDKVQSRKPKPRN